MATVDVIDFQRGDEVLFLSFLRSSRRLTTCTGIHGNGCMRAVTRNTATLRTDEKLLTFVFEAQHLARLCKTASQRSFGMLHDPRTPLVTIGLARVLPHAWCAKRADEVYLQIV
eukprot:6193918-Pleurochrysis_carterae.AAC.1